MEKNDGAKELHRHPLPETADPAFCACCRKGIISGVHNVMVLQQQGTGMYHAGRDATQVTGPRAHHYFHASCANDHSMRRIECTYCGTFCMATTVMLNEETEEVDGLTGKKITKQMQVPIGKICKCACHSGSQFCSLLVL